VTDPTETWRATFAIDGRSTSAQLRETQTNFDDTLADLLATQKALAASQANLTRAEAETREWRRTAERHLRSLGDSANALASARYENRVMSAELASALGRLNEQRSWQVARQDTGFTCSSCSGPIVRGQAFQPLADAKGFFAHCSCPDKEA
jgi:uncharacterized protein YPO0396